MLGSASYQAMSCRRCRSPFTSVLSHDASAYPRAIFRYMTLLLLEPNRSTPLSQHGTAAGGLPDGPYEAYRAGLPRVRASGIKRAIGTSQQARHGGQIRAERRPSKEIRQSGKERHGTLRVCFSAFASLHISKSKTGQRRPRARRGGWWWRTRLR